MGLFFVQAIPFCGFHIQVPHNKALARNLGQNALGVVFTFEIRFCLAVIVINANMALERAVCIIFFGGFANHTAVITENARYRLDLFFVQAIQFCGFHIQVPHNKALARKFGQNALGVVFTFEIRFWLAVRIKHGRLRQDHFSSLFVCFNQVTPRKTVIVKIRVGNMLFPLTISSIVPFVTLGKLFALIALGCFLNSVIIFIVLIQRNLFAEHRSTDIVFGNRFFHLIAFGIILPLCQGSEIVFGACLRISFGLLHKIALVVILKLANTTAFSLAVLIKLVYQLFHKIAVFVVGIDNLLGFSVHDLGAKPFIVKCIGFGAVVIRYSLRHTCFGKRDSPFSVTSFCQHREFGAVFFIGVFQERIGFRRIFARQLSVFAVSERQRRIGVGNRFRYQLAVGIPCKGNFVIVIILRKSSCNHSVLIIQQREKPVTAHHKVAKLSRVVIHIAQRAFFFHGINMIKFPRNRISVFVIFSSYKHIE